MLNYSQRGKNRRYSFDEASREYDEVRPGYPNELVEDVIRISSIPEDGRVLEVGCGTCQATIPFAVRGYSMLCLDLGRELVEIARDRCKDYPNVEILCKSFEDWKPEMEAFDLLISATAFHWIPPEIGYTKAAETLNDTGYIALFWNMHPTPYTGFFEDVQRVYRKVTPEWGASGDDYATEKKVRERENYIDKTELFEKVQVRKYSWSRVYSTNQYLKLLNTYSDHRSLADHKKASLYTGIKELIENEYQGKVTRPYLTVLYIAKKRT